MSASNQQQPKGGYQRIALAQLCRGFLLLQGADAERAKMFLIAFLCGLRQN
jgi:hypothetical protein